MRIVFMGSAALSCPSLEALMAGPDEVVGVVTQPDRPRGRNLKLMPSPVRVAAEARGVHVLTPEKVNVPEVIAELAGLKAELIVVVAYGQILRGEILRMPVLGCLNMHTSLLPRYRGAAPIQWAIANGDRVTGVTAMFINEKMDAGDIISRREVVILDGDTGGTLHDKLAVEAAALLRETVERFRSGGVPREVQDESRVTFAPKLTKQDGRIDWTAAAETIYNRVRAFNPWPCCFCEVPGGSGRLLRVLRVRREAASGLPGQVVDVAGEGPLIACRAGSGVRLVEVQPEGRRAMSGADYLRGHSLAAGVVLG